jgi:HipA-like C-terminal domain
METPEQLVRRQFLQHGVRSARELALSLGVSQPTISRVLAGMSDSLVRIGRGPSTRYGYEVPVSEFGSSFPLYLMGADGSPEQIGKLHSLAASAWWLERGSSDTWDTLVDEEFADGIFPGLPWFLDDTRPQGFLGRSFARRHGRELGVGTDPALWSHAAVVESLIRFGSDLPGAFVIGRFALSRALTNEDVVTVDLRDRETAYPQMASATLAGDIIGSSAGGEQPKFSANIIGENTNRHVLVKFSPLMTREDGQRWADLLYAEKIAADVLADNGFTTPHVEVFDAGGRRFLEVARFDRTTAGGRVPVVSLRALDSAFFGQIHTPWTDAAERLRNSNWLTAEDSEKLAALWRFGRLIANTDMHYGNASLMLAPRKPLALAPVYDMLPMAYRPGVEGQLPPLTREILAESATRARPESEWARSFWAELTNSPMVSKDFQSIARVHLESLAE